MMLFWRSEFGSVWRSSAPRLLYPYKKKLMAIGPYPNKILRVGFPGRSKLRPSDAEKVNIEKFKKLQGKAEA
jgi:hypothetical protein